MILSQRIAFATIYRREMKRMFRVWIQTLLPPLITSTLYFLIFGLIIGSQIRDIQGVHYMTFLAPGFIMMNLITSSFMHAVSSIYMMRFTRSIEEIMTSSTETYTLLGALLTSAITRGLLNGILVGIICVAFTHIPIPHPIYLIIVALLACLFFSTAGFINGLFARDFNETTIISTFILTPFIYLGGVFYTIDMLPSIWQSVIIWNPIFHIINGFRYACLGQADVSIQMALWMLMGANSILLIGATTLINRGQGIRQ